MTKLLILTATAVILFMGCAKDSPAPVTTTPSYFLKFKIDGTEYTGYSINANKGTGSVLSVAAAYTRNGLISSIGVSALNYTGPKTYSGTMDATIILGDQSGNNYNNLPKSPVTIKITQDDNTGAKGEFSGTLYKEDDTTTSISITDGSFYSQLY